MRKISLVKIFLKAKYTNILEPYVEYLVTADWDLLILTLFILKDMTIRVERIIELMGLGPSLSIEKRKWEKYEHYLREEYGKCKSISQLNKPPSKELNKKWSSIFETEEAEIRCHECGHVYQLRKNLKGETYVECPECGAKGIVG